MQTLTDYQPTYISSATTTQVASGKCILHAITIGETAAGTIKIIDGTSGSTVNVAELKASIAEGTYTFDCTMALGIRIITAGATKCTVLWSKA